VESPNNGHVETRHFVLVLSWEVKNILEQSEHLGPQNVSFIERFFQSILYRRFYCNI